RKGNMVTVEDSPSYQVFVAWLYRQDATNAETFWRDHLSGVELPTPLVVGRPMVPNTLHQYKEVRVQLATEVTAKLQSLASDQHVTLNTVMQGAWAILLTRYSSQNNVVFGATVAGRPASLPRVESAIG